jgi:methionyl-tRNA formyltransferase
VNTNSLRIAFMGSPACAVPVLERLHTSSHEIICVYTQPPRKSGRKGALQPTAVHEFALEKGLPVRTPLSLKKDAQARADFMALDCDAAVVAGYGMMLPGPVLEGPRFGCLNVHPSLLPRWRGTSPVQYALWQGDAQTGVSIIRLVDKMDAGPILAQEKHPITPETTAYGLNDALWDKGAALLMAVLDSYAQGQDVPETVQDDEQATYARLLTRDSGRIDWQQSAPEIDRQYRALTPWPGLWTQMPGGARLKITAARPAASGAPYPNAPPGTLTGKDGHVACGKGTALMLETIQPPGKKPMDIISAINGGYITPGIIFS